MANEERVKLLRGRVEGWNRWRRENPEIFWPDLSSANLSGALVLSERSVESDWVEWEAAKAREFERHYRQEGNPRDVLCPVCLDDAWERCAWPSRLRRQIAEYNILDFTAWRNAEAMAATFANLYEGVILNYRPEGGEAW